MLRLVEATIYDVYYYYYTITNSHITPSSFNMYVIISHLRFLCIFIQKYVQSDWLYNEEWIIHSSTCEAIKMARAVKPRPKARMDMILFEVFLKHIHLIP